jgi:predicted hotdog family 3-hydroxylacyl-ACP dehydratase
MAQSVAAFNAYTAWKNNEPAERGFLVGLKKIIFSGEADVNAGDTLLCRAEITDFLAQTYIAKGQIFKEGKVIADGELRIYAWR